MASIEKIRNKNGEITSYRIVVSAGFDCNGKRIKHKLAWKPECKMTERQTEKALQRAAADFERSIEQGYQLDMRQTFAEYAEYFVRLKEDNGAAPNTIAFIEKNLTRILPEIGHLRLSEIRPQHLNELYRKLRQPGQRKCKYKAAAKPILWDALKQQGISFRTLTERAPISYKVLTGARAGRCILIPTASRIASVLGAEVNDCFEIKSDTRPLSDRSISGLHSTVHEILALAEREMLIPYNPAERAQKPKYKKTDPAYFQPEEIANILDTLEVEPLKWRTLVHLLIVTGCRRGEIMGLHWSKIDLSTGDICIDSQLGYTPGEGIYEKSTKTGGTRFVRVPNESLTLLKKYRTAQVELQLANGDRWAGGDYVFTRDDGSPMHPSLLNNWLDRFSARHGLPHINPHAFRHSVASVLIANGVDIVSVSRQLGHQKVSTTEDVYAHAIKEARSRASDTIADVMLRRKNG